MTKKSQNNKETNSSKGRELSYEEMMKLVEKNKNLTDWELEKKYGVLSNYWD